MVESRKTFLRETVDIVQSEWMKYFLVLSLLFSGAFAQSLPQQYANLTAEKRVQYDTLAQKLKPSLEPIETSVRALAANSKVSASRRLQSLNKIETQLNNWVGDSVLKYTLMLPLRSTIGAQTESLATSLPLRIPYNDNQIKTQFNVSGAQPYAYDEGYLTLIRGITERGYLNKDDKVILYFNQGGPVITSIQEVVTNPGDREEAFLLADNIEIKRFVGGSALFIPQ